MITATVEEKFHPLNQVTYQVKFARTELAGLVAELRKAESRRKSLIVQGISRPAEELELKNIEKQIGNLRLKIEHSEIQIEGLIEDLPKVDAETRTAAGNLESAKERLPKVLAELEKIDAEMIELCDDEGVKQFVEVLQKRKELVEELTYTLPNQIRGAEGYLHLAPTREFPEAPNRPEKVQCLLDSLK